MVAGVVKGAWRLRRFDLAVAAICLVSGACAGESADAPSSPERHAGPVASSGGGALLTTAARAPVSPAVDVILIVIDTLRLDRTSLVAGGPATTPALAALAREGTSYRHAISHAPWTLPATAALLTGREAAGDRTTTLPGSQTLLADARAAGATVVALSGNPLVTPESGLLRGATIEEVAPAAEVGRPRWNAGALVDRALTYASQAPADAPLLLYLHLMDPHAPYMRQRSAFAPREPGWSAPGPGARTLPWNGEPADPQQAHCLDEQRHAYDGEVVATDAAVGVLLQRWPRARPQLVAVTADHGEVLWSTPRNQAGWLPSDPPDSVDPDHGRWMECRALLAGGYDEHADQFTDASLRVPLILRGPGVPVGRVEERLVATADLAGTIRALLAWSGEGGALPLRPEDPARAGVGSVGPRGLAWTHPAARLVRFDPRFAPNGRRNLHTGGGDGPSEAELERSLDMWITTQPNPVPGPDLATQERLRALGYTSGVQPRAP